MSGATRTHGGGQSGDNVESGDHLWGGGGIAGHINYCSNWGIAEEIKGKFYFNFSCAFDLYLLDYTTTPDI